MSFKPAWEYLGLKSKEEGLMHAVKQLFKDKDHIVSRGFTDKVVITVGDTQYILKGKNAGRKKDK